MTEQEYEQFRKDVEAAMYRGDTEWLDEHARCDCCCDEHTHEGCVARIVGNCRGQGTLTRYDIQKWAEHYGMTLEEFYGLGS